MVCVIGHVGTVLFMSCFMCHACYSCACDENQVLEGKKLKNRKGNSQNVLFQIVLYRP